MFPDETKSKAVTDYIKKLLPGADIEYRIDMDTFSYVFRIDYISKLQIILIERSFMDDREPDKICRFFDTNNISEYLKKQGGETIFISNRGISIKDLKIRGGV